MKLLRAAFPASLVLTVFSCAASTPRAHAADEAVLIDFADSRRDPDGKVFHAYEYTYEDWGKRRVIDLRGKGVLVQAPSGRGGLGENRTLVRFDKTGAVELSFVIGNGNEAQAINFALTDKDGTEHQWTIPLADRAKGQLHRRQIDLTKPDGEAKPGKTPGLDLKKISSWQVRGDYGDTPIEVLLVRLVGQKT